MRERLGVCFNWGVSGLPREIVLSNGRVFVALDTQMAIRDFFYPKVGLENHLVGHYSKLGIWVDRRFSWIDENWEVKMKYLPETMVSKCLARKSGRWSSVGD